MVAGVTAITLATRNVPTEEQYTYAATIRLAAEVNVHVGQKRSGSSDAVAPLTVTSLVAAGLGHHSGHSIAIAFRLVFAA